MKRSLLAALVLAGAIATASSAAESQAKSKKSVDAVYAVGCVSEEDGEWMLIRTTDAVVTEISPLILEKKQRKGAKTRRRQERGVGQQGSVWTWRLCAFASLR